MATATRTDVHRPAALDPEAYIVLGVFDHHEEDGNHADYARLVSDMVDRGHRFAATGDSSGSGKCGHCGQGGLRYSALLQHLPTGDLLNVGETCLDNRFTLTRRDFQRLRKQARLNRERATRAEQRAAWLADNPEAAAALAHADHPAVPWLLGDLAGSLKRYGSLSEKQTALVLKVWGEHLDKAWEWAHADRAGQDARAAGVTLPTGRVVVEGRVTSVRLRDSMYGTTWKMTVAADAGWRVWGTVPQVLTVALSDERADWSYSVEPRDLIGRRVRFTATVEASDDDPLFGFMKRPSKAVLL